jgi:ferredoxin
MAYIIAEPCIGTKDTACVDVCPVDCIHPAKARDYHGGPANQGPKNFDEVPQLYIHPEECIDCGACVPVCPVTAIFALEDLPEKWANYTKINADYFKPAAG